MKKVKLDILSLWRGRESRWEDISAQAYGKTWEKAKRSAKEKLVRRLRAEQKSGGNFTVAYYDIMGATEEEQDKGTHHWISTGSLEL